MGASSAIEWTEATWNPVVGCVKVSAGCKNCYAERMAARLAGVALAARNKGISSGRTANYIGTVNSDGHWSGRVVLDYQAIYQPLKWRTPKIIFVNSMSDLFQEGVPLEFIKEVFRVMNSCPQHTFQILTKRPEIAAKLAPQLLWSKNIWMGTSIEDSRFVCRVQELRKIKAHVRFLSLEPLIGPIPNLPLTGIDWIIVGGESGPGAREMRSEWVRKIRDRCLARGVPFFFKQWGGVNKKRFGRTLDGRTWDQMPIDKDIARYANSR